jgi:hypothetical protein
LAKGGGQVLLDLASSKVVYLFILSVSQTQALNFPCNAIF